MKTASSSEIKEALKKRSSTQLTELCLRLARFKKENKELLTFLLFEADDVEGYVRSVKEELEEGFTSINTSQLYFAKKSLRRLLRLAQKYIRYSGDRLVEVEVLLHYCSLMQDSGIPFRRNPALKKLYEGQVKKAETAISALHEDLQYDYSRQLQALMEED
jgi:hypothetical protein